jgi:hypothetical protein
MLVHLFNHEPNVVPPSWNHLYILVNLVNLDTNFVSPGNCWSRLVSLFNHDPNFVYPKTSWAHFGPLVHS